MGHHHVIIHHFLARLENSILIVVNYIEGS